MKEHLEKEDQELFPLSPPSASPALPPPHPPSLCPHLPSHLPFGLTCPPTFPYKTCQPTINNTAVTNTFIVSLDCSTMERPEIPSSHSCPLVCSSAPAIIDGFPSHVVHLVLSLFLVSEETSFSH